MTDPRTKRRQRALEASGVLRLQWPRKPEGKPDDVDETAEGLWRAHEEASWEKLQLRLATSFEAVETEQTRQWRRVLAARKRREARLRAAIEGEPSRAPLPLRRLWWWIRLRSAGGGGVRTLWPALKGKPGTAAEWTEAQERKHALQSDALGERHERQLARAAHAAARAYKSEMDGQVELCRRDARALLPGQPDREAGVRARPMASSPELAPPEGTD